MKIFIMFLFIFGFPINSLGLTNSTLISMLLLFIMLFFDKEYREKCIFLLSRKYIFYVFLSIGLLILYNIIVVSLHGTNDFSFITLLFHQFVNLVGCIALYSYVRERLVDTLIYVFTIQSVVQILCFLSDNLRIMTNNFRSETLVLRGQLGYGNIRGLSISGTGFFGLAVSYGIIFLLLIYYWDKLNVKSKVFKSLILILIVIGGMLAGRYFIVSLPLSFMFFKITSLNKIKKIKIKEVHIKHILFSIILSMMLIVTILVLTLKLNTEEIVKKMGFFYNYFFQSYLNFKDGRGFTSTSTDSLKEMYFSMPLKTFTIGNGFYTNIDGSYYMNTDAGFMRPILYTGIGNLVFLFLHQLCMLDWKKNKKFSFVLFVFLLISQIKGEVIGFLIISMNILFLLLLFFRDKGERTGA